MGEDNLDKHCRDCYSYIHGKKLHYDNATPEQNTWVKCLVGGVIPAHARACNLFTSGNKTIVARETNNRLVNRKESQ